MGAKTDDELPACMDAALSELKKELSHHTVSLKLAIVLFTYVLLFLHYFFYILANYFCWGKLRFSDGSQILIYSFTLKH